MSTNTSKSLIPLTELAMGDQVKLHDCAYGCSTVVNITDDEVTFARPFIHTGDFSYTGGVLYYTGLEEFKRSLSSSEMIELLGRGKPLK